MPDPRPSSRTAVGPRAAPRNDLEIDDAGRTRSLANLIEARPPGAGATATISPEGLTILLPPRGVLRGSHGTLLFALVWLLAMAVISAIWALIVIPPPQFNPDESGEAGRAMYFVMLGCCALTLVPMWLIGVGLVLWSVDRGRRRAIIDVVRAAPDAVVMITHKRLFRTVQQQWGAEQIEKVRAAISDEQVDNEIFYELRISPREGEAESLFSGRPREEIEWIAALLRVAILS